MKKLFFATTNYADPDDSSSVDTSSTDTSSGGDGGSGAADDWDAAGGNDYDTPMGDGLD